MPRDTLPGLGDSTKRATSLHYLMWALVGAGIFLRLFHFFDNRSLWIDEVYLSTSLVSMDFWQLATEELAYQQKAPIGFLWMVKLSVLLFGQKEMALRLVPLLSGIAALFVFLPVVRHMLRPLGAVLAMALLCLSPVLVYHSVEIKQYGSEMLASVLCLYLYVHYHQRLDLRALLSWGLWGALILWFSYSSIFVLAGISLALSLQYLLKKQWTPLFLSLIPFGLWLVSFALNFYLFTYQKTEAQWLVEWFRVRKGFPPADFSISGLAGWFLLSVYRLLDFPLGVLWNAELFNELRNPVMRILPKMPVFLFFFWLVGLINLFKKHKKHFWVLVLPLLLTFAATLIEKYPFYERLLVFLAPLLIIMLAHGCQKLTSFLPRAVGNWRYLMPFVLLFWPVWQSAQQLANPLLFGGYKHSYYRDGLQYIKENMQEGDLVLLYWNARPFYNLYNDIYALDLDGIQLSDVRHASADPADYLNRLKQEYAQAIGKKRVWFVSDPYLVLEIGDYDHKPAWYLKDGVQGGSLLHQDFTTMGKQIDSYLADDVAIYLYDLSVKN